jgi:hypothetical protein
MAVSFEVKRQPTEEKAGAAQSVRRRMPVVPGLPDVDEDYLLDHPTPAERTLIPDLGASLLPLLGQSPPSFAMPEESSAEAETDGSEEEEQRGLDAI